MVNFNKKMIFIFMLGMVQSSFGIEPFKVPDIPKNESEAEKIRKEQENLNKKAGQLEKEGRTDEAGYEKEKAADLGSVLSMYEKTRSLEDALTKNPSDEET